MIELRHYLTTGGRNVFGTWLDGLKDDKAEARIAARLNRLAAGNFGDCKPLQEGVWELRIDWGPGYRVYYAMVGRTCVLLLCGGDKRKQSADIARAIDYLNDYKRRSKTL
jgi:putative addiction module killer protein